jgi:hypothetical protein
VRREKHRALTGLRLEDQAASETQGAVCNECRPHRPAEGPGANARLRRRDDDYRVSSTEAARLGRLRKCSSRQKQNASRESDKAFHLRSPGRTGSRRGSQSRTCRCSPQRNTWGLTGGRQ